MLWSSGGVLGLSFGDADSRVKPSSLLDFSSFGLQQVQAVCGGLSYVEVGIAVC